MKTNNAFQFFFAVIFLFILFNFESVLSQTNSMNSVYSDCYGIWEPYQKITWTYEKSKKKWSSKTVNIKPDDFNKYIKILKNSCLDKDNNKTYDGLQYNYTKEFPEFYCNSILYETGLKAPSDAKTGDPYLQYVNTGRVIGNKFGQNTFKPQQSNKDEYMSFFDCVNGVLFGGSFDNPSVIYFHYILYKKIVNDDKDYSQNNNNNNNYNENITVNSELILNLYNQTTSVINVSPGENSTCQLQADVDCSNPKDKVNRKVKIEFIGEAIGSFNTSESTTDANGKAYFNYIAPDESSLKGKNEIKVQVRAVDVSSGLASTVIDITVMSRNQKSGFYAAHNVMPLGEQFYNELKILINAPSKGDGFEAYLTTREPLGLITKNKGDPGGEAPYYFKVRSGQEVTLYYHYTGSILHSQAIEEEVTLEIPELKFKQSINISIGMDLLFTRVNRKYEGPIYPAMPEPLLIHIVDRLHKGVDLNSVFTDFGIKLKLSIQPTSTSQRSVISNFEEDYMSRMLTMFEGFLMGSEISAPCGDFFAMPVKTDDDSYILVDEKAIGKTGREYYPTVTMFDRGEFGFKVSIADLNYREDPLNNDFDFSFTVDQYRDEWDEILKTAMIPVAKTIFSLWGVGENPAGGMEGLRKISEMISKADDFDTYLGALSTGNFQDALINIFGKWVDKVKGSKSMYNFITKKSEVITERTKTICELNTLAINLYSLAKLAGSEFFPKNEGGSKSNIASDFFEKLKYPQVVVKGFKDNYALLIEKKGIGNCNASLKSGEKLELSAKKFFDANSPNQRIYDEEVFIVIPFENNEEVNLNLDLNGTGGYLYRITKDKISKIEFPKTSTGSIIINNSNTLTFGKQEKEKTKEKEKEKKSSLFSGSWETTDFGTVSFIITGSDVVATCTKNLAGMKGKLSSDGTKITGSWAKFPTYSSPNDAGLFQITVSADGKTFTGLWGKGTDSKAKLDKTLNGKKK